MASRFCIELNVYTENYGRKKDVSIANTHFLTPFLSLSLSLYTARPSFEYYWQVYEGRSICNENSPVYPKVLYLHIS